MLPLQEILVHILNSPSSAVPIAFDSTASWLAATILQVMARKPSRTFVLFWCKPRRKQAIWANLESVGILSSTVQLVASAQVQDWLSFDCLWPMNRNQFLETQACTWPRLQEMMIYLLAFSNIWRRAARLGIAFTNWVFLISGPISVEFVLLLGFVQSLSWLQFSGVAARNKAGWSPLASASAGLQVPFLIGARMKQKILKDKLNFLINFQLNCSRILLGEAAEALIHQRTSRGGCLVYITDASGRKVKCKFEFFPRLAIFW